jgi:aspartyl-tRNA(Asn)/glutamyl-tRNA(Gln) amidotransferase subunit B
MPELKPVIGMEIHVELKTNSKMFCGCKADHFAATPNTQTCPVCLGMPGALPVPNKQAVEWTQLIGLGLHCELATNSKFDRKHYFYPDLPKGYQISQYDEPLCYKGHIDTSYGPIGITRVHLEEDTAKLQHTILDAKKVTLVDFNRSSVPLVEIVTDPDITSAKQAKEYAQKIHQIVQYLGVSDADMEKGSMRVEANISWGLDLGYKVEVKNINSFKFLEKAIEFELKRQKELLDQGITPTQETRGWSESRNETYSQRTKESAEDYRYFPEPDIPPMVFTKEYIASLADTLPDLPEVVYARFTDTYHVRPDFADTLTQEKTLADYAGNCFSIALKNNVEPNQVAKYLVNKPNAINDDPQQIVSKIQSENAKPTASSDDTNSWISEAIKANPDVVEKYKSGKTAVIGVLVGDVMRRSKGQADAKTVTQLIQTALST